MNMNLILYTWMCCDIDIIVHDIYIRCMMYIVHDIVPSNKANPIQIQRPHDSCLDAHYGILTASEECQRNMYIIIKDRMVKWIIIIIITIIIIGYYIKLY